jgi:5-methylcytosine-specific restriction endonuclease McrA
VKTCSKCGAKKPLSSFRPRPRAKIGYYAACRKCEYRLYVNHEKMREYGRRFRAANIERLNAKAREYAAQHKEERAAYLLQWQRANREKTAEYRSRRYARERGAGEIERIDRTAIYDRDGGRCHICERKVAKADFTLDHLIPVARGGPHISINLRVAHRSCNSRMRVARLPAQLLLIG